MWCGVVYVTNMRTAYDRYDNRARTEEEFIGIQYDQEVLFRRVRSVLQPICKGPWLVKPWEASSLLNSRCEGERWEL